MSLLSFVSPSVALFMALQATQLYAEMSPDAIKKVIFYEYF